MATRDYTVEGAEITPRARTLTRLTRLALAKADFRPAHGDTDDRDSVSPWRGGFHPVTELHAEDFGIALEVLDVRGRLAAALGLAHG